MSLYEILVCKLLNLGLTRESPSYAHNFTCWTSRRLFSRTKILSQSILADDAGSITGLVDREEVGIKAFGMVVFALYECFVGNMERGHSYPCHIPAGYQYRDHRSGKAQLTRLQHPLIVRPGP